MSDQLELTTREETNHEAGTETVAEGIRYPEIRTVEGTKDHSPQINFKKSIVREYFESAVVTLVMALFGMTFIVQAVKVPTGSMKNTIWIQDHLLVNKFIFGPDSWKIPLFPERGIRRGDVVVFKFPKTPETNFVKRVIGLPGDTVEYDSRSNTVYINGQPLPERRVYVEPQYNNDDASQLVPARTDPDTQGAQWTVYYYQNEHDSVAATFNDDSTKYATRQPFKVPVKGEPVPDEIRSDPQLQRIYDVDNDGKYDTDQYFCMGDNRDNSLDSRFWGTVPRSSIVGHAMFVYWSIDRNSEAEGGNPILDFFTKSRWSRTGKFIK